MSRSICNIYECSDRARYIAYCWISGEGPSPWAGTYVSEVCGYHRKRWPVHSYLFAYAFRRIS